MIQSKRHHHHKSKSVRAHVQDRTESQSDYPKSCKTGQNRLQKGRTGKHWYSATF